MFSESETNTVQVEYDVSKGDETCGSDGELCQSCLPSLPLDSTTSST